MPLRSSQVEGGGLALVLAFAAIGLGVIDLGLASHVMPQSGNDNCTIIANAVSCIADETFSPVFSKNPTFQAFSQGCVGGNCGLSQSIVSISNTNIFDAGNFILAQDQWVNMPVAQTELFGDNGQHW